MYVIIVSFSSLYFSVAKVKQLYKDIRDYHSQLWRQLKGKSGDAGGAKHPGWYLWDVLSFLRKNLDDIEYVHSTKSIDVEVNNLYFSASQYS